MLCKIPTVFLILNRDKWVQLPKTTVLYRLAHHNKMPQRSNHLVILHNSSSLPVLATLHSNSRSSSLPVLVTLHSNSSRSSSLRALATLHNRRSSSSLPVLATLHNSSNRSSLPVLAHHSKMPQHSHLLAALAILNPPKNPTVQIQTQIRLAIQ